MSTEKHHMGSAAWVEHVLSTPPARALKGPSKPTQYHDTWSEHVGRHIGAQGRNEANCVLLLEYLANLGLIRKFKEQPFRTSANEFGYEIVPDYMAIGHGGEIYLIEAKSARYLTAEVEATLARNRAKFAESNITYLIWTDRHPFNKHVRHALVEMHRQNSCVPDQEIKSLKTYLHAARSTTFEELVDRGFDQGVVYAAAWRGKCHFELTEEFCPETCVSASPVLDLNQVFLVPNGEGTGWWNELPSL